MSLLAISISRNSQLNSKIAFWVSLLTGKRYEKSCWIRTLKNSISQTMWTVWTVKRVLLQQDVSTVALASTFVLASSTCQSKQVSCTWAMEGVYEYFGASCILATFSVTYLAFFILIGWGIFSFVCRRGNC